MWLPILTAVFLVLLVEFKSPALTLILKDVPGLAFTEFNYFDLSWVLGVAAFLFFVAICVVYSLFTFVSRRRWPKGPKWLARYSLRRLFEIWFKWLLPASAILVVVGTLPMVVQEFDFEDGSTGIYAGWSGVGALILGFVSALSTFVRSERNLPIGVRAPLGVALFFYGVAVLTCAAAIFLSKQGALDGFWMTVFWAVLTVAVVTAVFVNSNYISLHRFYRDRLMEAFMPDQANIDSNATGAAKEADGGRLSDMWNPGGAGDCGSPYHILNANLVLVDSDVQQRQKPRNQSVARQARAADGGVGIGRRARNRDCGRQGHAVSHELLGRRVPGYASAAIKGRKNEVVGALDGFWMTVFWAVLTVAVVTAVFVNSNYISLHRFYRDRLMEAFMPDQANIDSNATGAAKEADGGRLSDMWNPGGAGDCGSPYHILNANR